MDVIDLRSVLGKWVKDHPNSNQVHCVLHFEENILVSYCGRRFLVAHATEKKSGMLKCSACQRLYQERLKARKKAFAEHFNTGGRYVRPGK